MCALFDVDREYSPELYLQTTATLSTFFLCMLLRKDAQVAAQEELDRICTSGKLPTFDDRDKLPFVTAVMLETLRHV